MFCCKDGVFPARDGGGRKDNMREEKLMTRREAREQAFVLLFEELFHNGETLDEIIENAAEGRSIEVDTFAYKLATGATLYRAEVDEHIERHSTKWKKNRISRVALAILRLSAFELLYANDIPDKVSINEAVELAKKFGSEEDGSFVNGVLGAIVRARGSKNGAALPGDEQEPDDAAEPEETAAMALDDAAEPEKAVATELGGVSKPDEGAEPDEADEPDEPAALIAAPQTEA